MVYRQRRLYRVAPQVGQRSDDVRNAFGGQAHWLAVVVDAQHQRAAVGGVGKRHQVLGQSIFVIRQLRFPVEFVQFMRHRAEALLQAPQGSIPPVFRGHVIASA